VAGLNRAYREQGRPYRILPREGGYEMALRPAFRDVRERLFGGTRPTRLAQPALDTLALVAYRQPGTRPAAGSRPGADSARPLRQLLKLGRGAVQRGDRGQKEVCYGTTTRFLREFGLRSLEDLPRTQDLPK